MTASRLYLVNRVYRDLLDLAFDETGSPQKLILSPCAKKVWIEFYNSNAKRQAATSGSQANALAKIEEYAARLALVVHLGKNAERGTSQDERVVDEESMSEGVRLAEWFAAEMTRNHAILKEDDEERRLRKLYEYIERVGGIVTLRDITHGPRAYRGVKGADRARDDLDQLARRGFLARNQRPSGPDGGRPTSTYTLVPRHSDQDSNSGDKAVMATDSEVVVPAPLKKRSNARLGPTSEANSMVTDAEEP